MIQIDVVSADDYLVNQNDRDASLIFLVQGSLEVSILKDNGEKEVLFNCVPGEFMGSLSLLTGMVLLNCWTCDTVARSHKITPVIVVVS